MPHSLTHPSDLAIALKTLGAEFNSRLVSVLRQWAMHHRQRAELRRLLQMDPELIADFGLTVAEVEHELGLPFWQPLQLRDSHL